VKPDSTSFSFFIRHIRKQFGKTIYFVHAFDATYHDAYAYLGRVEHVLLDPLHLHHPQCLLEADQLRDED
jgi:hypothetical protein